MATSKDKHKVKYGPPPKAAALDVENYMRSRGDLPSFDSNGKDEKQEINDKLLQIISTGIDDIVLDLKKELGEDFESSNAKAFQISDILNQLKNNIDIQTETIGMANDRRTPIRGAIGFDRDNYGAYFVHPDKRLFYRQDIHPSINDTNIQLNPARDFRNLDDSYASVLPDNIQANIPLSTIPSDKTTIENRLKNCQNLEFLYLKKHDEIMKIFKFTINLFDKYKYAIKVILFLLKNLVYKEPGTDTTKIDLPLPIITNIKKLVEDQNAVQGIINSMETTINNPDTTYKDRDNHLFEERLNTKILPTPPLP